MAAERFAKRVERFPARYIGMVVQIALGVSTVLTPPTIGTTYAYVENSIPFLTPLVIGVVFILTGLIMGCVSNKWVYWIGGVMPFGLFALIAFIGAQTYQVSYQAMVLYVGLAAYAFVSPPSRDKSHAD